MRLQITAGGNLRATLQPRADGTQSRLFCCTGGHGTAQEAAEHGAAAEVADELAVWLRAPQPEIVTEVPVVKFDEATGKHYQTTAAVEPFIAEAGRPIHAFDKRAVADKRFPAISRDRKTDVVDLLGVKYRIVHEDAARFVGVLVTEGV